MSSPKDLVLVVGAVDYGEADRIVHVLSRRGRASLFAPSARKSRRRFAGALEPFTTIEVQLAEGRRRGMPTLASAAVAAPRSSIRTELERIALASYVAELSAAVAPEEDAADPLFDLCASTLDRLDDLGAPVGLATRRAFELRLLAALGYAPSLERCVEGGCAIGASTYLDLNRGGIFCEQHRGGARAVGPFTLAWMNGIVGAAAGPVGDDQGGLGPEDAQRAATKLGPLTEAFFSQLLGRPLRSSALLATLSL